MPDELLNGEIFYSLKEAQIIIEGWRWHYNALLPHASLGYRAPAPEVFVTGLVAWPYILARRLRRPRSVWRQTNSKLTFRLDHSVEAGHSQSCRALLLLQAEAVPRYRNPLRQFTNTILAAVALICVLFWLS